MTANYSAKYIFSQSAQGEYKVESEKRLAANAKKGFGSFFQL